MYAAEIDAQRALKRWLTPRRRGLEKIALRGTWFDEEDVTKLLRLSLPGIDEVAALIEIARVGADKRFGLIVVDTAPTGHTLRMLTMPKTLGRLASTLDRLMGKHRVMARALTGTYVEDDSDALIAEIDTYARRLGSLLQDSSSTHMTWVTLPETMSVEETRDAAVALARNRIQLRDVIVNRLTPPPPQPCRWCESRRAFEAQAIRALRLPNVNAIEVATRSIEPRGIKALTLMGDEIAAQRRADGVFAQPTRGVKRRIAVSTVTTRRRNPDRGFATERARLLLFGGKGGVGKTTCAAATALSLAAAAHHPVLLLSTDPAHSLTDVLGQPVSNTPRRLRGLPASLRVREIDAARQLDRIRNRYARTVDGFFDRLASGRSTAVQVDLSADRDAIHSLIELAPPGLDELAAIIDVLDAIDSDVPGTLVIDTAPTGHALRLLEMPELVHDWVKVLMSILLKYQPIARIGELGSALVQLSQGLGRLRASMTDPTRTSFIVVTRGAILPSEETVDLLRRLARLHVHVPVVIVNAVGRGTCRRCQTEARIEGQQIRALRRRIPPRILMTIAPTELPPPHGRTALVRWQRLWRRFES